MIINFTVGNYRSFKAKKVLSMEATAIKELNESVIEKEGYRLLPSAVIYGANSSGKSNFLKAIGKFGEIVNYSSKMSSTDKLNITPFLLNQKSTHCILSARASADCGFAREMAVFRLLSSFFRYSSPALYNTYIILFYRSIVKCR